MNSKTCLLDTVNRVLQKGSGCCSECFNGFSLFPGVYWKIDTVDSWNPSPVERCLIHHLQGFTLDTPNTSKYYISQAICLIVSLNITRVSLRTRQKHDVRSELDGHPSTGVMTVDAAVCCEILHTSYLEKQRFNKSKGFTSSPLCVDAIFILAHLGDPLLKLRGFLWWWRVVCPWMRQ